MIWKILHKLSLKHIRPSLTSTRYLDFKRNLSLTNILFQTIRPKLNYKPKTINPVNAIYYSLSALVFMIGATYAAVPLYKAFCELQGIDVNGNFKEITFEELKEKLSTLKKIDDRPLKLKFMASTASDLQWSFAPCQSEIHLTPGETVLAFYRAKNNTNRSIVGISTYNILPFEAALYFNKVQCFCFEEQCIEPGEEVDLPVFFFIDEEFTNDPLLKDVDTICLSYTFFESKDSNNLQLQAPKIPKALMQ